MLMKSFLVVCVATVLSTSVSAQFTPSRQGFFNGGFLECGIVQFKDDDGGRVTNPIYKIMVNLSLDKNSSPISMTVTHVAVDGSNYNRHEQYTVNPELTGTQGKMEWFWSGTLAKNKSLRMKGAVIKNDSGIHYYETLTKGNRVTMQMHSICHLGEPE
jgi:hypothetical protein